MIQITSEYHHSADTKGQGEECLAHGSEYHISNTGLYHLLEIRNQIETNAIHCSLKEHRMDRQYNHDRKQRYHHNLCYFLNTGLQPKFTYDKSDDTDQDGPEDHGRIISQHGSKGISNVFRISLGKITP